MEGNLNVSVVLPAAGCGERLGNSKPKQYCLVLGKPLICYTIEGFERISWVNKIVIVTAPEYMELMREIIEDYGYNTCEVTSGGPSRHKSIAAGIKALSYTAATSPEIVIIHDAVRPLVPIETLKEVVWAAKQFGAAGAVRPLVSTVISSNENGFLEESLDRSRYRASEMPQAFQYHVIKTAYEKCTDHDLDYGTECLHLALKYAAVKAKLIDGSSDLWKVTHKKDLYAADGILRESSNQILIVTDNVQSTLVETIQKTLDKKFAKVAVCDSKIREPGDYSDYNNIVLLHYNKTVEELVKSKSKGDAGEKAPLPNAAELQGTIIHVLSYTKEPFPSLQNYPDAFLAAKRVADASRKPFTCVHLVWNVVQMSSDKDKKIVDIIVDLVHNRSLAFHGQLFVV